MQPFLPNLLYTPHVGQANGRGPSPRVWRKAHGTLQNPDGQNPSIFLGDDFNNFGGITATGLTGGYYGYIETDATAGAIDQLATVSGGAVRLLTSYDTSDGDNHDTVLIAAGNTGTFGAISDTAGSDKLTIFETRFRLPSVTDGDGSFFVGLTEEGLGAANTPLVDSSGHTLSSDDLIGFVVLEDDNDALKFVYRKNGAALQTLFTYGTALAASTWYKVGFVYDPTAPESRRITVYIDNVEQSTYVTATNIAASTFPDGEELVFCAAMKNSADNDPQAAHLDWWQFFQAG